MTARTVGDQPDQEDASALAATAADIARRNTVGVDTTTQSSATTPETPISTDGGVVLGSDELAAGLLTSNLSERPSKPSNKRWRQPRSAREFAAQVNAVATMVLNEEINIDTARTYSSVARTVAQTMSAEVTRSRFLKSEPNLELPGDVWENDDV